MPIKSSYLPDGVEDITAVDAKNLESTKRALIDFYESEGFQLTYPSLVEFADAIGGDENQTLKDSAFSFNDDLSTKELAIRPDISQQIARIDQAEATEEERRYCYAGEVLKKRKDSFSRSRITIKSGVEIFGGKDNRFEILKLLSKSMEITKIKDLTLSFGKTEVFDSFLNTCALSDKEGNELNNIISTKSESDLTEWGKDKEIEEEVKDKLIKLMNCKGDLSVLSDLEALEVEKDLLKDIESIWNFVDKETLFEPHIDMTDFPGFNYHSGLVFSVHSKNFGFSIANGGQYNINSGTTNRSAIGFDKDLFAITKINS